MSMGGFIVNPYRFAGADSLLTGLVSWWSMDEASGNRADSHGSNTLTDHNTVGSTTGVVSNAADFVSASSEYLSSSAASLQGGTGDFSAAGWFYVKAGAVLGRPVSCRGGGGFGTQAGWQIFMAASGGNANLGSSSLVDDGSNYATVGSNIAITTTDTWFHFAMIVDRTGDTVDYHVNGSATPQHTIDISGVTGSLTSAFNFTVGASGVPGQYFSGYVDELGYWSRKLTTDELSELYASGSGIGYPG